MPMRENIFQIIIKWWSNCVDLCFEAVAHPWEPDEAPYRRMLATVFGQRTKLSGSFAKFLPKQHPPTTYSATRELLRDATQRFWHAGDIRHQFTPHWPEHTVAYLKELFGELLSERDPMVVRAFYMMHGVEGPVVPKKDLPATLGVEKIRLYNKLDSLERRLRLPKNAQRLAPFALADHHYGSPKTIIREWRNAKYEAEWQAAKRGAPESILRIPIRDLRLSARAEQGLIAQGVKTIEDLLSRNEMSLLRGHFGRKSLNEVREVLVTMDSRLSIGMLVKTQA